MSQVVTTPEPTLPTEVMLIMTSVIRVGQSKFDTVPIDKDSDERILSHARVACGKMLGAQEMCPVPLLGKFDFKRLTPQAEACGRKKKEAESTRESIVQVDDLLNFRQFSKKSADGAMNYVDDPGKATGAAEVHEDFLSNLSRISQLTGGYTRWYYAVSLTRYMPRCTLRCMALTFYLVGPDLARAYP
ncbi:hypothetical protein J3R83DRAFT_9954 [Lanmaoa asiatica]|nr:hypothetical protein J3R83DRAFT_9954 [Lanmaoa asiatica]